MIEININNVKHYIRNFKRVYNIEYVDWERVSIKPLLSEDFMENYKDYLNWNKLSLYQPMSEQFIDNHLQLINWNHVIRKNKLSGSFILKYLNRMDEDSKSYVRYRYKLKTCK